MSNQILIAALLALSSCRAGSSPPVQTASLPERVVTVTEFGGVVNVHIRDVIVVRAPMQADEWQVAFDDAVIVAVGTPGDLRHPGREGWRFRAIAAGDTSLVVTPILRGGANPPRLTLKVHSES
jgi:hypothetical protein